MVPLRWTKWPPELILSQVRDPGPSLPFCFMIPRNIFPNWHMTFIQHSLNVGATPWFCIEDEATYKHRVPAGFSLSVVWPWWLSLIIRRSHVRSWSGQAWQHSFVEIDSEIFSTVIPSLKLIQDEQMSFLAEECAQVLVNCLEDKVCPGKSVVR